MRHLSTTQRLLLVLARGLAATCLLLVILLAGLSVIITAQANRQEARRVDAILVMGAAQWDGEVSPVLRARLDTAFNLFRKGYASRFILTGGVAPGDQASEASVARSYLVERGVPESAILIEEQGRDSLSSLRAAAAIARREGISSVLIVTDAHHQLRVLKMTRDLELQAYGEPAQGSLPSDRIARAELIVREAWGYLAYVLFAR